MGKPNACTAKQPSEVCPVCTTNLQFLRVRVGDEGSGVNDGQRVSQLDVNQVYYVFGHLWYLAMLRRYARAQLLLCVSSCVAKYDLSENLFSRVTSQHRCYGATFEFSSTGWYRVRDTPIKCGLTWDRTKYGSTTCRQRECVRYGTTASLISASETSVDWNQNVTSQQIYNIVDYVNGLHVTIVNVLRFYHVRFEVIGKYFYHVN